jgi:hypothetical protein
MRLAEISSIKWKRYFSRFTLLLLGCAFVGCGDNAGCEMTVNLYCGETKTYNDEFTLTEQNSSKRLTSPGQSCAFGSYHYRVAYRYQNSTDGDPSLAKNRPNIRVKVGTVEHGVLSGSGNAKPVYNAEYQLWVVEDVLALPEPKKDEEAKPFTLVMSVTMNKPLIQLGSTAPTISLPVIGTIIGPKPKDVFCQATMWYSIPK